MASTSLSVNSGNNAFKACYQEKFMRHWMRANNNAQDKEKPMAVRNANIMAARGMPYTYNCREALLNFSSRCRRDQDGEFKICCSLEDKDLTSLCKSLGPRGMDKMVIKTISTVTLGLICI